jgi:hypothetical protein
MLHLLQQLVLCYLEGAIVFLTMLVVKAAGKETVAASFTAVTRR